MEDTGMANSPFQALIDGVHAVEGKQSLPARQREETSPYAASSSNTNPSVTQHDGQDTNHGRRPGMGSGPGRKSRACAECKKQKMKCEVMPGDQACRNCLRRNHQCTMKRAQGNFEPMPGSSAETYEQKIDAMRSEIRHMRMSLDKLVGQNKTGPVPLEAVSEKLLVQTKEPPTETPHSNTADTVLSRDDNIHMAMTRENSPAADHGPNGAVTVEDPMNSLFEVTRLRNIRSNHSKRMRPAPESRDELNDFITRGVISEAEAEELYNIFHGTLNHYLWVGLEQTHPSFSSVRKSSELLTATILTVTALHMPNSAATFDACYKEFLSLISSSMFSRYHSIDDVRGLVIAAFWLSEVSWKLSGHAIRIATELGLHGSFIKALEGDREHFLRARLWYMLYVCDHHFSIAYGRPPMIAESQQIREHERFLASPLSDALDMRVLSQVNLMQILTRIWDRFGERGKLPPMPQQDQHGYQHYQRERSVDGGAMLSEMGADFADLRSFNLEIDAWRMKWVVRQHESRFIGTFPSKGIVLYSYFAKLQLNSLAIRGVSLSPPPSAAGQPQHHQQQQRSMLSTERKEFANMAISAAASILTFVLEEEDMRRALVGTPLYVHTMIAFASVFLMKIATKWNRVVGLSVESGYVCRLLERMIDLLKTSVTSDRHVLHYIAIGLEKMLQRSGIGGHPPGETPAPTQQGPATMMMREPSRGDMNGHAHINAAPIGGPPLHPGMEDGMSSASTAWDTYGADGTQQPGFYGDDMSIMNNNLIWEAFGSDSSNDVYNLLNSQFSY